MVRSVSLAVLAMACLAGAAAAAEQRPLDLGWHFRQDNGLTGAEAPAFDDSAWQSVDLPHTWNHIGNRGNARAATSNSIQGVGWYRHGFKVAALPAGKHYFLQFDGVGEIADVWLNGQYLGSHKGAFQRFRFDATKAIKAGDNVLVVKADNSKPAPGSPTQDIIPLSGDFLVHGGIYRPVSLLTTDAVHIDLMDFGGPGVYARALSIDPASASVEIRTRLADDGDKAQKVSVETRIEDGAGHAVAGETDPQALKPGTVETRLVLKVDHPHLWDATKDPYLYRVVVTVKDASGAVIDRSVQPLGLRTYHFDPNTGLTLNGHPEQMRGASRHQDRPNIGWAITKADIAQDFDIMQDMGANAVRLAHYQHAQFAYDETDRRGLMVWAEIPLVNAVSYDGSPADAALAANAETQLRELIKQNYNHPSILMWSIGNETDLTPTQKNTTSRQGSLLKALNGIAHEMDPGRVTTLADCCEQLNGSGPNDVHGVASADRDKIVGITDVVGYNRYYGWYMGKTADFGPFLDLARSLHPNVPMGVSEYGAGGALSQHTDNPLGGPVAPKGRPHPEEYETWYHETSWPQIAARPYIWGVFIWNMFDFASDSRAEGDSTDINDKGLVSADRSVKKDVFYYYRANWNPAPTLHLADRRYIDRAYAVTDVKAYSNARAAELWVNGADTGAAACSGGICLWPGVHLQPGDNTLKVTATIDGTTMSDSLLWQFNGRADTVRIRSGDVAGLVSDAGERYGSDAFFSGGEGRNLKGAVKAGEPELYTSYREGAFSYDIPVPDGRYDVRLRFVEPAAAKAGERTFDVAVNGAVALPAFDVFAAAGGKAVAVDKVVKATAAGGHIHLDFTPRAGQAVVSDIEVMPAK
jgi:beta-galactosidase